MNTINFTPAQKATVPVHLVQSELVKALSELFGSSKIEVQKEFIDTDLILTMTANGICATLHIQESTEVGKEVAV